MKVREILHAFSTGFAAATADNSTPALDNTLEAKSDASPGISLAAQHLESVGKVAKSQQIFGDSWFNDLGVPRGLSSSAGGNGLYYQLPYSQLRILAHQSDLVRLCISEVEAEVSSLEWYLTTKDSSPLNPRAVDLLQSPDGARSWAVWVSELLEDSMVLDQVALFPWIRNGKIVSVEVMDGADFVPEKKVSSRERTPLDEKVYRQISSGQMFSQEELWLIQRNTRTYSLRGYSKVEQLFWRALQNFWQGVRGLDKWKVDGLDKVIVGTPDTMTEVKQVDAHQERLNREVKTTNRYIHVAGDPRMIVPGVPPIDGPDAELLIRFVCSVVGVDPTSLVSKVNYNTADSLERWSMLAGMWPQLILLKSIANKILAGAGYPDHELKWRIEAEVNYQLLVKKELDLYKSGLRSWQELRQLLGDTVELVDLKGHTFIILFGAAKNFDPATGIEPTIIRREDGTSDQVSKSEAKNHLAVQIRKATKLESVATDKKKNKLIATGHVIWQKVIEEGAREYKELALSLVLKSGFVPGLTEIKKAAIPELAELVDDGFSDVELFLEATTWEELLHNAGVDDIADAFLDSTIDINQEVKDSALSIVGELIGKKYIDGKLVNNPNAKWKLSDETRSRIDTYLTDAIEQGLDVDAISIGIDKIIDDPVRANIIARTEGARAYNIGTGLAYQELGLDKVEVSDNEGPNSCAACKKANGEIWTIEKYLNNPIEHPNCVRTAFPEVEEEG